MDRRKLLISLGGLAGLTLIRVDSLFSATASEQTLVAGESYIAEAGSVLKLPALPQHKDSIHIVVDKNSLKSPATVYGLAASVAGDWEPLTLDSLAIFRLVYDKPSNNWILA